MPQRIAVFKCERGSTFFSYNKDMDIRCCIYVYNSYFIISTFGFTHGFSVFVCKKKPQLASIYTPEYFASHPSLGRA